VGGHQDPARQRDLDQAEAADVGAVLRRRADRCRRISSTRCATRRRSATAACRRPTNGIEFAKSSEFAKAAFEAGPALRVPAVRRDRQRRQLAPAGRQPVRRQAARDREPARAGVDIVPVTTIVNGVNNEQVGRIVQFALDNPKKINFLSFQPVSVHRRDEEVTDERRAAQRYTLSHLAHDVKNQIGIGEPVRDWFPISFMGTFTDWADLVHGPSAEWGNLTCGCHPNCGIGMAIMIDKETKEAGARDRVPRRAGRWPNDLKKVNDAGRGKFLSSVGMALALMKNYDPFKSPTHFKIVDLMKKFDKTFGATGKSYGKVGARSHGEGPAAARADRWELPVHRRHVVPGPSSTTISAARALHHPVCDAGRGRSLLRLQHGQSAAEHHREDAHDRPRSRSGTRSTAGTRSSPAARTSRSVHGATASCSTPRRSRRDPARSRRSRHREDRARREAACEGRREEEGRGERADGGALQRACPEGRAGGAGVQIQGLGGKKKPPVQEVLHKEQE
jgi:hypothetical protein